MFANKKRVFSRRDFLRISATTVMGATIAACAPVVNQSAEQAGDVAADTQSTLRLWHHWGGTRVPLMDTQIADFMAAHPEIQVEVTLQPWEQRLEKLLAAVAAGDPPDSVMLSLQDVPQFAKDSAILPLDEYMEASGITLDQYYAPEATAMVWDGKVWNLPNSAGGAHNIMFYNPQLFEAAGLDPENPPQNWAELSEAASKLVVIEDEKITQIGCHLYGGGEGVMHYLACNNAAVISEDGLTSLLDNPAAVETLEWMLDLIERQGSIDKVAAFESTTSEFESDPFYGNRQGIRFDGSWYYFYIKSQAPDFEYRSVVAPTNNDSPWTCNFGSSWGYVIPTGVEYVDAAWELVQWLTYELEGSCKFMSAQLQPHPRIECTETPVFTNAPFWDTMEQALQTTRALPGVWPVYNRFNQILNDMHEEILYHQKTPAEAVATASEDLQSALDEFWTA